jgi:PEP-CTERM motif
VKRLVKVLVCLTLGLMTARAAAAAPVTVNFQFEVDKVDDYQQMMLGGHVKVGDVVSGSILFDSAAADESPEAEWGFYSFLSPHAITLSLPTPIVSNDFYVQVQDGAEDMLHVNGLPVPPVPALYASFMAIQMHDPTGGLFNSDALALTNLDAAQLASLGAMFSLQMGSDGDVRHILNGRLVSFTTDAPGPQPPSVPEPTSMLLLGTGLIGVARMHRKRANERNA